MRAVLTDPDAPAHVALGRAAAPTCNSDQALVRVRAVSLNRGELFRASFTPAGHPIGWDVAGVYHEARLEAPSRGLRSAGPT